MPSPGPSIDEITPEKTCYLPEDLKEALGEFSGDEVITGALGKEFSDIYIKIKRDEWRSFISEVTQWEIDNYLTRI